MNSATGEIIRIDVELDAATHTYTYLPNPSLELRSCTEFVDGFFEPFNGAAVARKLVSNVPKYRGRSQGSLEAEWHQAAQDGTDTHDQIAARLRAGDAASLPRARAALDWLERTYPAADFDYVVEHSICGPDIGLAGTPDLVVRSRTTGSFVLLDWKTNREIKRAPYRGKRGVRGPGRRLDDCHLVKYGLQLSLYRHILESWYGIEPEEQALVHLTSGGVELIPVPYRKRDVIDLLEFEGVPERYGRHGRGELE